MIRHIQKFFARLIEYVRKSWQALVCAISLRYKQWCKDYDQYVHDCLTSGKIPKPFRPAQWFAWVGANIWIWVQIGRIRVIGAENLKAPGRRIYCPNHSAMFDPVVLYAIYPEFARYMTAFQEMRGFWGLKAIIMAAFGCYVVERGDKEKRRAVLEPAAKDLAHENDPHNIFFEGKINKDAVIQHAKHGPATIARMAFGYLNKRVPLCLVPIYIHYNHRDPETAVDLCLTLKWRGGVTVVVGKPIYLHQLPAPRDPENASIEIMAMVSGQVKMMQANFIASLSAKKKNDGGGQPPELKAAA